MPVATRKTNDAPDVGGTAWIGQDHNHWEIFRLELDGTFDYENSTGRGSKGTWRQVGDTVLLEIRSHAIDYRGKLRGDTLQGRASNDKGERWTFRMVRAPGPVRLAELARWITKVVAAKEKAGRR